MLAPLDDLRDQYESTIVSMNELVDGLCNVRNRAWGIPGTSFGAAPVPPGAPGDQGADAPEDGGGRPIEVRVSGANLDRLLNLQQHLSVAEGVVNVVLAGGEHGKATLLVEMSASRPAGERATSGTLAPIQMSPTLVCAWCGTVLSVGGTQVSHGLCAACAEPFIPGERA